MKENKLFENVLVLLILVIPIAYLAFIYPNLPNTIPTHFNFKGESDGFGSKQTLIFTTFFMTAVSVGTYLLVTNIHKIDPKKNKGQSPELMKKIGFALLIFLSAIQLIIIQASKQGKFNDPNLIVALTGLFFAVLGNFMHSVKPNYFVGFRLPWTLENEENWRKTHQLVSKLWVAGGVLIAIVALLIHEVYSLIIIGILFLTMIAVPCFFSYSLFKKNKA